MIRLICPDPELSSVNSSVADCSRVFLVKNPHVRNGLSSAIMSQGLSLTLQNISA